MRALLAVLGTVVFLGAGPVQSHTMTIGYANAGPGAVTFWFGSWHDLVPPFFEGSFNLVGVAGNPFPSTTVAFNLSAGCSPGVANCPNKPTGLVDGSTNFYACTVNGADALCPTDQDSNGPVNKWQGVTFTGLQAGQYRFTYIPIANPSADWAPANTAVNSSVVTLSGAVVGGGSNEIPTLSEWAMILMMTLLVGTAWVSLRRR
jgi:hypothetical protein